ncbi:MULTISPECIES: hypothetical protein [unclassified Coleofasciculus]|uniref:hypothetical protein n=1 Tax=unclassified Coleofasciculus TaxID=2692782 RepID=UPI001880BB17|nr:MULTISPECIES: hypothetical protein [unclassified Coleofasciculus]MBE9129160.1 hypothetical protein [Coleofasciculus sp. LEGE 07081]MBE9151829.1 hypothetical protein [Coleofasciculus sp. LEGE 07092]
METKVSNRADVYSKEVRLLLFLWDLGGADVKKGDLNKRLKRKKETAADYQDIYKTLEKDGAIAVSNNKISLLMPKGLQILGEGLKSDEFHFESAIGAKAANALLKWIREHGTSASGGGGNGAVVSVHGVKASASAIASYDEFKQVALEVYDRLNRDYNLDDLVPIYRIRREIGDRVSRSQFSEWMLEMQANDIFELMGGEVLNVTPDQLEDSITPPVGKLRYFAKRVNPEA